MELCCILAVLATLTTGVKIECNYQMAYWSSSLGDFYQCDVQNVYNLDVENPETVTAIIGTHVEGKSNTDVRGFYIWRNEMSTQIIKNIENFFPNLEIINLQHANIFTIDSSTFEPFKNLFSIDLSSNKLVTLDGDLFRFTPKLQEISFYNNSLQHVGHGLLTGLSNLKVVDFQVNPCIHIEAKTPYDIRQLNLQLPIRCPPSNSTPDPSTTTISSTSEPNGCPNTCTINEEAQEMKEMNVEMQNRIEELEKQMRELNSDPRSCKPN